MSIHIDCRNELLARLPAAEFERLAARMRPVTLDFKQILYQTGAAIESVYFPNRATVSALATMDDNSALEVATIGKEGMVGLGALLADNTSANDMVVQIAGDALAMDLDVLEQEAEGDSLLRRLLRLYQAAYRTQISYSVVCNMLHSVQQRCCRCLLMTADRVEGDSLPLTHEFLALMLRVRRASVPEILRPLNEMGMVRSRRGAIVVVDRRGLEQMACACYRKVRESFDRLMRRRGAD
jgi:CRP-like cAMP-binding protein